MCLEDGLILAILLTSTPFVIATFDGRAGNLRGHLILINSAHALNRPFTLALAVKQVTDGALCVMFGETFLFTIPLQISTKPTYCVESLRDFLFSTLTGTNLAIQVASA